MPSTSWKSSTLCVAAFFVAYGSIARLGSTAVTLQPCVCHKTSAQCLIKYIHGAVAMSP